MNNQEMNTIEIDILLLLKTIWRKKNHYPSAGTIRCRVSFCL